MRSVELPYVCTRPGVARPGCPRHQQETGDKLALVTWAYDLFLIARVKDEAAEMTKDIATALRRKGPEGAVEKMKVWTADNLVAMQVNGRFVHCLVEFRVCGLHAGGQGLRAPNHRIV